MLFVNPTALGWAGAKGESLGTKGGFSWTARNRQPLAEMLGVRAPLLPALSCGALQTFPRTPVSRGGFASCSHLEFLGHTGACWPLESRSFVPVRTECGTRNVGTRSGRSHLAAFAGRLPGPPDDWCCLSGKAPCLLPLLLLGLEGWMRNAMCPWNGSST